MVLQILEEKKNFTPSEKAISEYILQHLEQIYEITTEELAQRTFTSKATIVRFCKKVTDGKGYLEFKMLLMAEISEFRQMTRKNEIIVSEFLNHETYDLIQELYYMAETTARNSVNKIKIAQIVNKIILADFIDLFGTGIDFSYARAMAYNLRRLGIFATALEDLYEYDLNEKNKKKIAMVFGVQKPLDYVNNLSNELKGRGYYVISFLSDKYNQTLYMGDAVFEMERKKELGEALEAIYNEKVLKYILDVLIINLEKKKRMNQK